MIRPRPAPGTLLVWVGLLMGSAWLFLAISEDVLSGDPMVMVGQSLYQALQQLRSPLGDRVMVVVSKLGDRTVLMAVVLGVLAWLHWRQARMIFGDARPPRSYTQSLERK